MAYAQPMNARAGTWAVVGRTDRPRSGAEAPSPPAIDCGAPHEILKDHPDLCHVVYVITGRDSARHSWRRSRRHPGAHRVGHLHRIQRDVGAIDVADRTVRARAVANAVVVDVLRGWRNRSSTRRRTMTDAASVLRHLQPRSGHAACVAALPGVQRGPSGRHPRLAACRACYAFGQQNGAVGHQGWPRRVRRARSCCAGQRDVGGHVPGLAGPEVQAELSRKRRQARPRLTFFTLHQRLECRCYHGRRRCHRNREKVITRALQLDGLRQRIAPRCLTPRSRPAGRRS